jgi:O-6-methylguanine DNA methyltransferase
MEAMYYSRFESPAGPLVLVTSERGILRLEFAGRSREFQNASEAPPPEQLALANDCRRQLEQYFAGKRREFTVPLDLRGTPFQLACWNALLDIPYGETRTYAEIARVVKRPQGFRAVGLANNRNPIVIIVPCHRVIASDGTLCGYGGGLDLKRKLLELEGALAVAQPALIA